MTPPGIGQSVQMLTAATERSARPHGGRILAALAAAAVMWVLSSVAVAVFLTAPMAGFDEGRDPGRWSPAGVAALSVAIALFVGSGPVAHYIGRRRWLLALPVMAAPIWAAGVAIAYLT